MPASTVQERLHRAEMLAGAERVANLPDVIGGGKLLGPHISEGEIKALIAIFERDPRPAGFRDAALIALGRAADPRWVNLAYLTVEDFRRTGAGEGDLVFHGRGKKQWVINISNGAYSALVDWLHIRGSEAGPFFCAINTTGRIRPRAGLSGEDMQKILHERLEAAKVVSITQNDIRGTFVGSLLSEGAPGDMGRKDLGLWPRLKGYDAIIGCRSPKILHIHAKPQQILGQEVQQKDQYTCKRLNKVQY